jgi:hypothetical protein
VTSLNKNARKSPLLTVLLGNNEEKDINTNPVSPLTITLPLLFLITVFRELLNAFTQGKNQINENNKICQQ